MKLSLRLVSDWFRLQTLDDSFQPTIDMLLNLSIFVWFGAVCPWSSFLHNDIIPIYRLIPLGIATLLFRRIPVVFALHWNIWQIEEKQQALAVGFFGPIGVSAVFYLYVSVDFLNQVTVDGVIREDAAHLIEVFKVVVWFLAICSIVSVNLNYIRWARLTDETGRSWPLCSPGQARLPSPSSHF